MGECKFRVGDENRNLQSETSQHGLVESDGGFPASIFCAVDALHALRHFRKDLAVDGRSCVGLPVQDPAKAPIKINLHRRFSKAHQTKTTNPKP